MKQRIPSLNEFILERSSAEQPYCPKEFEKQLANLIKNGKAPEPDSYDYFNLKRNYGTHLRDDWKKQMVWMKLSNNAQVAIQAIKGKYQDEVADCFIIDGGATEEHWIVAFIKDGVDATGVFDWMKEKKGEWFDQVIMGKPMKLTSSKFANTDFFKKNKNLDAIEARMNIRFN